MTQDSQSVDRFGILVAAETPAATEATCEVLAQLGFEGIPCADLIEVSRKINDGAGAGAALVAEEVLDSPGARRVLTALEQQEPWSDFAVLLVGQRAAPAAHRAELERIGNVTFLERPVRQHVLKPAIEIALRARKRQYEARRAIRQRDEFLAMLGHELRNPLGAIILASDMLKEPIKPQRLERCTEILKSQTRRLNRIVDDLLDVSRVTTGKIPIVHMQLDLREVLTAAIESTKPAAQAREIDIVLDCAIDELPIEGDAIRLEQVFANLLANAVKFSPPGSKVDLVAGKHEGHAQIVVRDRGIGIPAPVLPRIFDLFMQGNVTLDRTEGGLGIGLTLVRRVVQLHGGTVSAHSAGVGQGAEFTVGLPLREAGVSATKRLKSRLNSPSLSPLVESPRKSLHVVLIEDSADIRDSLKELLELLGHKVDVAPDGRKGIDMVLQNRPKAAVVDIGIPVVNGYEVAKEVRAAMGSDFLLVALTGYGQPEDRRKALDAGFDVHLTKPVNAEALASILERGIPGAAS